jgi:hypothetical protein
MQGNRQDAKDAKIPTIFTGNAERAGMAHRRFSIHIVEGWPRLRALTILTVKDSDS